MSAQTSAAGCEEAVGAIRSYLEGDLAPDAAAAFLSHVQACAGCKRQFDERKKVLALLGQTYSSKHISENYAASADRKLASMKTTGSQSVPGALEKSTSQVLPVLKADGRLERFEITAQAGAPRAAGSFSILGAAPWWGISVALHVLIIILLGLITMTLGQPPAEDMLVVLTNLKRPPDLKPLDEPKSADAKRDLFKSPVDVPPTDPNSSIASNIIVPPDILAQAELGDHFETINLDRPDTHSAFGNPEARMFHSVSGNDEPEGGGGMGGQSLLDDLIGVGGSASPGSGGGWGGGNGTGTGIGNGSGNGSFGQRNGGGRKLMVMRHGGSQKTESTVDHGLDWLARHQEPDGHWDSVKYGAVGKGPCDTACTGWALLAFLGAGHTEKVGKYKETVQKGIAWLIGRQEANGALTKRGGGESLGYNHSIAGMALAEAAAMGRVAETKAAAQKAIDYTVNIHQCGEGSEKRGWRYGPHAEGDLSNSGWFIMQLKSAKVAGLHVEPSGFDGAEWFLNHTEDKNFAKDAANPYDNGRHRYGYVDSKDISHRRTAIGCLCRQFLGTPKEELAGGVEWFVNRGGVPGKGRKEDLYYWYYGTLCTFQQGEDVWKRWNEALKPTLLDAQKKGGDEDGSWDPSGAYSEHWGRVGQTALSIMCLEVYYRYLPMYKE